MEGSAMGYQFPDADTYLDKIAERRANEDRDIRRISTNKSGLTACAVMTAAASICEAIVWATVKICEAIRETSPLREVKNRN